MHRLFARPSCAGPLPPPLPTQVYNISEFAVQEEFDGELLGEDVVLEACALFGGAACQLNPEQRHIAMIHDGMKVLCDRLGASVARTADILVLMEGSCLRDPAQVAPQRIFALLSQVSYSPKFQDWTICDPDHSADTLGEPLQLPLRLSLGLGPTLFAALGLGGVGLRHEASCDLAARMSEVAMHWRLRVCQYKLVSPMVMDMTGFEPSELLDIKCQDKPRGRRAGQGVDARVASDLAAIRELEHLGDPLSSRGASSRATTRTPATRQDKRHRNGSGAGAPRLDEGATSPLGDMWLNADNGWGNDPEQDEDGDLQYCEDFALVMLEQAPPIDQELAALSEELLIPAIDHADIEHADLAPEDEEPQPLEEVLAGGGEGVGPEGGGRPGGLDKRAGLAHATAAIAEVVELAAQAAGVAGDSPAAPVADPLVVAGSSSSSAPNAAAGPPQPQPQLPMPDVGASLWPQGTTNDGPGAVGGPIPDGPVGWTMTAKGYVFCDQGRCPGRITSWGPNVSVRCTMHSRCRKAKGRARISDGRLAHWLAEGLAQYPPGEGALPREELANNHMRLFPL